MFISCIAFRREKWIERKSLIDDSIGSSYVHTFVMHSIMNSKSSIYAMNKILVKAKLSQNEWTVDVGKFLLLDCLAIIGIYERVRFEEGYFHALCRIFKRTYPVSVIFKIMVAGGGKYYLDSKRYLYKIGYGRPILWILYFLQVTGFVYILYKFNKLRKNIVLMGVMHEK